MPTIPRFDNSDLSLDYFASTSEHREWNREAKRLCRLSIYNEFECRWKFDRNLGRLRPIQYFVDQFGGFPEPYTGIIPVGNQRLQRLFKRELPGLRYSEHIAGDGRGFGPRPVSWAWRALSRNVPISLTRQVIAGLGKVQVPQPRGVRSRRVDRS